MARAGAAAAGLADLRLHILPRPVGAMSPEEVRTLADEQIGRLVADLTGVPVAVGQPARAG